MPRKICFEIDEKIADEFEEIVKPEDRNGIIEEMLSRFIQGFRMFSSALTSAEDVEEAYDAAEGEEPA